MKPSDPKQVPGTHATPTSRMRHSQSYSEPIPRLRTSGKA